MIMALVAGSIAFSIPHFGTHINLIVSLIDFFLFCCFVVVYIYIVMEMAAKMVIFIMDISHK